MAGKTEMSNFTFLFWAKAKQNLFDGHIWFSLFQRPVKSTFTRIQRLTCCLSLIFCAMCASIAWYGAANNGSPELKLGPMKISLAGIYVGLMCSVMTFPINLLIVAIFHYSEPSPEHKKILESGLNYIEIAKNTDNGKNEKGKTETKGTDKILKEETKTAYSKKGLTDKPGKHEDKNIYPKLSELDVPTSATAMYNDAVSNDGLVLVGETPVSERQERQDKKRKRRLPHWCRYIGFALCFATVGVAFWATVEIAGVFGREKSLEWLISFFFSTFESIFISQPFKVMPVYFYYRITNTCPCNKQRLLSLKNFNFFS